MTSTTKAFDLIQNCPGWGNSRLFLQEQIKQRGVKWVADVGGGANPVLDEAFVRENALDYSVIDISAPELRKAPSYCQKIEVDLGAPASDFSSKVGENRFELMFSHMLFEHIEAPLVAHQNIYSALVPGGLAIHLYASANNLPLALNRLLPEWLGRLVVKIAQPERDLTGHQVKFPAYYKLCGNPSRRLHEQFERIGYTVIRHTSYIGHSYYRRFPLLRDIEYACRRPFLKAGIPLTSAHLLILKKQ